MDDDPADGAEDASGFGHDALCEGESCPVSVPGQVGTAFHFDGADDHLVIPHHPELDTTEGFTVSVWFYPEDDESAHAIVARPYGQQSENSWVLQSSRFCGPAERMYLKTVDAPVLCAQTSFRLREWNHVAVTWDGAGKWLWLNGQLSATQSGALVQDVHDIIIGGDVNDGESFEIPFAGAIDDVRIYERALEHSEILELAGR